MKLLLSVGDRLLKPHADGGAHTRGDGLHVVEHEDSATQGADHTRLLIGG